MRAVLTINRTGPTFVVPLLANEFPHHSRPLIDQQAYVQNLLRMLSYAPVLREQVLGLIVDRIVQLDVELQVDVEDLDANPSDAQFLFEMDGVSPDGIPDGPVSTTAPSSPTITTANIAALNGGASGPVEGGLLYDSDDDLLDNDDDGGDGTSGGATMGPSAEALMAKLDHLLYIVLSYLSSGAATEHCTLADVYTTVLSIFDRLILPTYKSRHTQFLLFYLASRDPAFTDVFLGMLAHKIMNTAEPTIVRMSAALYMASFVARANYLPAHHVAGCFRLLVQWCGAFVVANEQYVTYPDVNKFGVFYAVTQAVLYMFCFRWRELMSELGEKGGLEGFELVVLSKFNPLKVLSPPVVNEFARITHEQNVLYCYAIIQRNKRLYLPTQRSAISSTGVSNDSGSGSTATPSNYTLDPFFPFDPFKLPLSSAFIDPLYTDWQGQDDATATATNSPDSSATSSPFVTPVTREGTPVPFTHQGAEGESRNPSYSGMARAGGGAQSAPGMPRAVSSAGSVRRRGSGGGATHTPARATSSGAASSFHHVGGTHQQNEPMAFASGPGSGSSPFHGNVHQHSTGFFSQPPSPSSTIVSLSGYGSERRGPSMSPTAQPSQPMRVPGGRSPLRRNNGIAAGAAGDAGFDMEGDGGEGEEDGLELSEGMQAMSISPDRQGSSVLMSQLGMGRQ
ncbi:RNA polymerase I-specific transcription initiation factor RRN3-domain-containing protein [Catenaria anguillulae PL171]|uniref:RNA polymerase I-specific transcription initiation factor RRN3-domain-containing protein n=1 Tax=Catenaria anguillulae PL171 TaxID=765915 RepID=A0A1Y2HNY8_9FUNG|nr:RNA polymerase I-specific transcription initiation factor RRN3-domain-containing protein [Catenaria anguillulae PL171]